ncbi:hypothetical protein SLEP1_g53096 [Rubroshorea leprosula]|uniref:PGG domain-containing protein n=1 Tax=Rubroshorea leprosula TaxID=152421 RepID=A0AAV5M8C8_9ROSI|nr:hypothetical protein SLEP1_g53096 [Rubroshorea leprosula]
MVPVAENAERHRDNIMVKLWIAEIMELLNDVKDIIDETIDANKSRLTAEVQSSANKPWKLILNLFNKISRFMRSYREKRMVSKVKYITVELKEILDEGKQLLKEIPDEGKQLLKEIPDEGTQFGPENRLTTPDPKNLGRKHFAIAVRNAIYKGEFGRVRDLFERNPDALSTTFENGQTALHVAITSGQLRFAKELITWTSSANSHQLGIKDESGNTALYYAARSGMMEIAKRLIEKNKDLLTIPDCDNMLPVQLACRAGHEDMTRYLYLNTLPQECLKEDYGFFLLEECITKKIFGTRVKVDKRSVLSDGVSIVAAQRRALDEDEFVQSGAVEATFQAMKNGIPQIAIEIAKVYTNILWNCTDREDSRNMFACAIAHRQEEVAQFLYEFNARIGAARLQSELRWFNAVKGIVPQFYNYFKNNEGYTPSQVFVNEHEKLLKEAEEWVKKTAESSTVVGTLIITIMFAVAFTVPASDAISLFAASSSVLMFLGILASRYAYEDFFKSLPVKLIIGISSLFISIAAMMVAFCVALFIMLQGHLWIVIPVTLLAGIPIIIFVLLLSPFLVELYAMTFGPGIFDRKKNSLGKEEMESLQQ